MVISAQRRIGPWRDFFCANLLSAILLSAISLFREDPRSLGLVAAQSPLFASTVGPQEPRVAFEVQTRIVGPEGPFLGSSAFPLQRSACWSFEGGRPTDISNRVLGIGPYIGKDPWKPGVARPVHAIGCVSACRFPCWSFLASVFERIAFGDGIIPSPQFYRPFGCLLDRSWIPQGFLGPSKPHRQIHNHGQSDGSCKDPWSNLEFPMHVESSVCPIDRGHADLRTLRCCRLKR